MCFLLFGGVPEWVTYRVIEYNELFVLDWLSGRGFMIDGIIRRIEEHSIQVRIRRAVSLGEDLGRIRNTTLEVIDDPEEPTIAAFTLCHLFGHLVQFTRRDQYKHLIDPVSQIPPVALSESFWREFYCYEREAFGYGASILEGAALPDDNLKCRYAKFMEVDFQHFRSFVSTGNKMNRQEYRDTLHERYTSDHGVTPIVPISLPAINWAELKDLEATIY
jgi:hypothetical protein